MNTKSPRILLTLVILLVFSAAAHAAVFVVPPDEKMISDADAIVLGRVLPDTFGSFALNGDIVTHTKIEPETVLKGTISASSTVEVRDLGGVVGSKAMGVSGGVGYLPGERVLVFLVKDSEGYWTTYGMVLGKMISRTQADGRKVLSRAMGSSVIGFSLDGTTLHVEQPRDERAFLAFIRNATREPGEHDVTGPFRGGERDDSYFVVSGSSSATITDSVDHFEVGTNSHYPPSAYTSGTFRWDDFDKGSSVTYYASGSQPGYDSTGAAQRALAAWTNDPSSNVRLVYGGTRTNGFVSDGVNAIVFNNSTDVPAGAIGFAKWYADATHTYKGETFYSISEGDVVIKAGISVSAKVFDEAVTHEVGHTLGFRHSDQGTPSSTAAVMRSVVTGTYGAALGPWDIDAVSHVYGSGTVTPCTAPSITTQPTSRSITSGTSTTLTAAATGTTPLTYQWYAGTSGNTSTPVAGATGPSLTVTPGTTTAYWVRVSNACGSANSSTATITVSAAPPAAAARGDFNGDGNPDLIWRHVNTGANSVWYMDGTAVIGTATLPAMTDLSWVIGGVGDMNGDGRPDIIWRNPATGQNSVWFMNNTTRTSYALLPSATGSAWTIGSVTDWDRDGDADLIWRNTSTGQNSIWIMNGTARVSVTLLPTATPEWDLGGSGDANGDGQDDLFWRSSATGQVALWLMGPSTYTSARVIGTVTDQRWQIAAVADMNGDGYDDLVWRHATTGANSVWYIVNGALSSTAALPAQTDTSWRLVAPH